jgi:hypothetical protein
MKTSRGENAPEQSSAARACLGDRSTARYDALRARI